MTGGADIATIIVAAIALFSCLVAIVKGIFTQVSATRDNTKALRDVQKTLNDTVMPRLNVLWYKSYPPGKVDSKP